MKAKRVLLMPSDGGGGFGHVTRCLAIAAMLKESGCQVHLTANQAGTFAKVSRQFPTTRVTMPPGAIAILAKIAGRLKKQRPYQYLLFDGIEFQFLRDGIFSEKNYLSMLKRYLKLVDNWKPDLIIGDTHLFSYAIGKLRQIPVIQIVRYLNHPDYGKVIWWDDLSDQIIPPDLLPVVNAAFADVGLPPAYQSIDVLRGDHYIVPSIPEIEPIHDNSHNTSFIGALISHRDPTETDLAKFLTFPEQRPLIYVSFGGGAKSVQNRQIIEMAIAAFSDKNAETRVNVIIANPFLKEFGAVELPDNIRMFDWVPGAPVIDRSDLIIFHGGYGTFMEVARIGKPAIVIPFHAEQEGNGRRLQQIGIGDYFLTYSMADMQPVKKSFRNKAFQYLVCEKMNLDADGLRQKAEKLMRSDDIASNIEVVKQSFGKYSQDLLIQKAAEYCR